MTKVPAALQPKTRDREPTCASSFTIELLFTLGTLGLIGAAVFLLPYFTDWAASDVGRGSIPQAPALQHACRKPAEDEQLVILVHERDGKQTGECVYVRSRGAYGVTR